MKVSTSRLKEAVNKAINGAGFNKLIPLTSMIGIKLCEGKLTLNTSDMSNDVSVIVDKVEGEPFDVCVDAEKFGKLISKISSDDIELTVSDAGVLNVKGNGTYKIALISDEDGLVQFPVDYIDENLLTEEINLTSILSAYNINKSALAKTLENPALTGYFCGDMVITTDANVITFNKFSLFNSAEPILVSAQMMYLLSLYKQEKIKWGKSGERIFFATDDMIISGTVLECVEDFPVEQISAYLEEAFPSSCKIPKELLLSVLDRLALFIEPYDKNGAYFTFGRKGITIHSKKDASVEVINYVESKEFSPFVCCVDIPMLKEQVQANPEDTIKLYYGNENALKIETGNVVQVIALLEDENLDDK